MIRLIVLTLSLATGLVAQYHYYVPEVVDGNAPLPAGHTPGTKALNLRTTFVLVNTGTTEANITIAATNSDSSPRHLRLAGLGSGSSVSTSVAPGAARMWTTDGTGDGSEGAAVVTSSSILSVSEILSNTNSGNPVSETTAPALGDQDLVTEYLVPIDTIGADTGVALYNPGTASVNITVKLLDGKGKTAKTEKVTLAAGHHTSIFATANPLDEKPGFRGSMDVASSAPIAAVTVRRNSTSSAYSLFPASGAAGHSLHFFIPGVADGRSGSETTRTTFVLTNVSSKTATVKLALKRDDSTAFKVHLNPGGANSSFQESIGPGVSLFLQTDGSTASLTSGSASITSNQPIAATAVVSNADSSGAITETTLTPAPRFFQFALPFDNGTRTSAAARFYNGGSQPVTLTLHFYDVNGKTQGTKQLAPLAPGKAVSGAPTDFFGSHATKGTIVASTGNPLSMLVSAVAARETSKGQVLSASPGVAFFGHPSGTPPTVTPSLDTTHQATADINATGGSLNLSDAKGNQFTLTIPAGALLDRTTITMTAISSATGLPGTGLIAGVELEPDGLPLLQPAQLKIDLASPPPNGAQAVGWRGQSPGIYLNPVLPDPKTLTIALTHFSGAGMGGGDLTSELLFIDNKMDLLTSTIGGLLAEDRQAQLLGDTETEEMLQGTIQELFNDGYESIIVPLMQLAESSQDPDVIRCAIVQVLGYERQRQLLGTTVGAYTEDDAISTDVTQFVYHTAPGILFPLLLDRCKQHDFSVYDDLLGAYRQFALLGSAPDGDVIEATVQSCLPQLELDYNSLATGQFVAGSAGTISWNATMQGSIILQGSFLNDELNHISDPAYDLFTSFEVQGSGKELYKPTISLPNQICSVYVKTVTPDTMSVIPGTPNTTGDTSNSRIKFQFDPHYDPAALDFKSQQLCSYCPVYRKKPVAVDLYLFPGIPGEIVEEDCPDLTNTLPEFFWLTAWSLFHFTQVDPNHIADWDLQNTPQLLAQKSESNQGQDATNFTLTEQADFKLKPCTGPAVTDGNGEQTCTGGDGTQSIGGFVKR
jgi:hypothetical protein